MKTQIKQFIENHPYYFGALSLFTLTLLAYGDVIFGPSNMVISHPGSDISLGLGNVMFSFSELAQGNFPLWNPHLLSGYPWFASFQTLLLYPPAWIFLFFSAAKAINIFIAFHVFLIGFSGYCWLKHLDLHPFSSALGGALLMLSSQVTMQIYSGAVTPIATMPWMIFLLLAVDSLFGTNSRLRWTFAGIAFVALQIMAGFPQHVYYTGLIIGVYVIGKILLSPTIDWRERLKVLFTIATIYVWGVLICAVQLFSTFSAATETARQGKLPFSFAGSYSFPPWNLFTLLAPKVFGDDYHMQYWGRSNVWEMLFYIGVIGLFLSICGLLYCNRKQRFLYLGMVVLTLFAAFGFYTPFYIFLYNYIPGFGSFRANFRILFECSVFLITFAAIGFDALLKATKENSIFVKCCNISLASAIVTSAVAFAVFWQSSPKHLSWFKSLMLASLESGIQHMEPRFYTDVPNILNVAKYTSLQLTIAAITLIVVTLILYQLPRKPSRIYYLGVLAVMEIFFFTATMRPTFPLQETTHPAYRKFLEEHPSDLRFVQFKLDNWANTVPLQLSGGNLSGYESFRLRRYDSFAQFAMGQDPNEVKPSLHFEKVSPLFGLLRCQYLFKDDIITVLPYDTLPHLLLVPKWNVIDEEQKVLLQLSKSTFNPRSTALLESQPQFPQTQFQGKRNQLPRTNTVSLLGMSTNWLDIKATTRDNTILLVTDAYAKGWKVFPYADSTQQKYDVMPADYVLRGIPLSPGTHHFRLQYAPDAFYWGRNISLAALVVYLLTALLFWGWTAHNHRRNGSIENVSQ